MARTPRNSRTLRDLLKLRRTISCTKLSWMHLTHDGRIVIVNQRNGTMSSGMVKLTRAEFEKFQRFYRKAQR